MLSLMVSGCSTPQLEGVKELSNHPEFPKAREAAPEFTRAALRKIAKLDFAHIDNADDLIKLWNDTYSESWRQDFKIKEMYDKKLAEFDV